MRFKEINFNPGTRELRIFALLWLAGFGAAGALVAWRGGTWAPVVWGAAIAGGVVGALAPRALRPVYVAWMVAAFPLGWTVSLVLLALVYYAVFTPLALIFRLLRRDVLGRTFDRQAESYWVRRPPAPGLERYFKQF